MVVKSNLGLVGPGTSRLGLWLDGLGSGQWILGLCVGRDDDELGDEENFLHFAGFLSLLLVVG